MKFLGTTCVFESCIDSLDMSMGLQSVFYLFVPLPPHLGGVVGLIFFSFLFPTVQLYSPVDKIERYGDQTGIPPSLDESLCAHTL